MGEGERAHCLPHSFRRRAVVSAQRLNRACHLRSSRTTGSVLVGDCGAGCLSHRRGGRCEVGSAHPLDGGGRSGLSSVVSASPSPTTLLRDPGTVESEKVDGAWAACLDVGDPKGTSQSYSARRVMRWSQVLDSHQPGHLVGHVRVSTGHQTPDAQNDALAAVGIAEAFSDVMSGNRSDRSGFSAAPNISARAMYLW